MTRRLEAAQHVRSRTRQVAGVTGTITRGTETIAEDITIVKISALRYMQQMGGEFAIDSQEHIWLIGEDACPEDIELGDLLTVNEIDYRFCESANTGRHWQWWDAEQTAKVYVTRVWQ